MGFYLYMLDGTLIKDYRDSAAEYKKVEFLPNRLTHLENVHSPYYRQYAAIIMYHKQTNLYSVDIPNLYAKRDLILEKLRSSHINDIDLFVSLPIENPEPYNHHDIFFNVPLSELLSIAKERLLHTYRIELEQPRPELAAELTPRFSLFCSANDEEWAARENDIEPLNANMIIGFPEDGESPFLAGM